MRRARQQRMMRDRAARPRRAVRAPGREFPESFDGDDDAEAREAELARRMLELEA
jgi:hypothetical protein